MGDEMEELLDVEYSGDFLNDVEYIGLSFKGDSFGDYLRCNVKPKFDDADWNDMLSKETVELTGFSADNFVEIFENREMINEWRMGELVAECVLEDQYKVRFYYNYSRDSKNLRSNQTGADLVGFCDIDNDVCFLFGEVKTSYDPNTPPNVLYGKSGMIYQLESLKNIKEKRHDLVKWIAGKALIIDGAFKEEYGKAMKSYISSGCNKVNLVGVLVRDTEPDERDIKSRAKALSENLPSNMKLKIVSLYTGLKMENKNWEDAMNRGVESDS
jgi:hypothetical protein